MILHQCQSQMTRLLGYISRTKQNKIENENGECVKETTIRP